MHLVNRFIILRGPLRRKPHLIVLYQPNSHLHGCLECTASIHYRISIWSLIQYCILWHKSIQPLFHSVKIQNRSSLVFYQTSNHLVLPYPVLFCFALLCPNVKASYQGCHDLPLSYRAGPRHEKPSRALVSFARTSLRGWAARCCAIYFGPVCVN